jgi:hypothetical protein
MGQPEETHRRVGVREALLGARCVSSDRHVLDSRQPFKLHPLSKVSCFQSITLFLGDFTKKRLE